MINLGLTPQMIYDFTVNHLRQQGCRSMINGNCRYRGKRGRKCSIGCHIPDDIYHADMERMSVHNLDDAHFELRWMQDHRKLLFRLMDAHDREIEVDYLFRFDKNGMETVFRNIADEFKLTYWGPEF